MESKIVELENMFNFFNEIIEYIASNKCSKNECSVFLGNGDKLNYRIPLSSIPHLLGINIEYLIERKYVRNTNSYDAFKEFVNKGAYQLESYCKMENNNRKLNYDMIFSKYIEEKLDAFYSNIRMILDETKVVCKYLSKRNYTSGLETNKYDYVILKEFINKNGEKKIGVLCIVLNNFSAVPMSNREYNNLTEAVEDLENTFQNQELTIMTGIMTKENYFGERKQIYLNTRDKLTKIEILKRIKELYSCSIDISYDYGHVLKSSDKFKTYNDENSSVIDDIVKYMQEGKIIPIDSKSTQLKIIIDVWNNYITNGIKSSENESNYSEMKENLKMALELIEKLQNENDDLKTNLENAKNLNNNLSEENNELKDEKNQVLEILTKQKTH